MPMPLYLLRRRLSVPLLLAGIWAAFSVSGASGCSRVPKAAAAAPPASGRAHAEEAARPAPKQDLSPLSGYPFTSGERAAVEDFLRRNPRLRLATDDDRRRGSDSDSELRGLYGVYHPYFVRGDLDDDGVLDFVLGFVRKDSGRSAPWFSVVVFTGRTQRDAGDGLSFSAGTFLERDVSIARGDLAVDRDAVVITPDLGDDNVRRYRWDVATRTFLFVQDDDSDSDAPHVSTTAKKLPAQVGRGPSLTLNV
jgi:hypothetical protein